MNRFIVKPNMSVEEITKFNIKSTKTSIIVMDGKGRMCWSADDVIDGIIKVNGFDPVFNAQDQAMLRVGDLVTTKTISFFVEDAAFRKRQSKKTLTEWVFG